MAPAGPPAFLSSSPLRVFRHGGVDRLERPPPGVAAHPEAVLDQRAAPALGHVVKSFPDEGRVELEVARVQRIGADVQQHDAVAPRLRVAQARVADAQQRIERRGKPCAGGARGLIALRIPLEDGAEALRRHRRRGGDGLQAFFTYGYIDASFDDTDDAGRRQTLAGNRFRLTPEHSASAGLDWRFGVGEGLEAYVRPSWNWRSQVFFEDQNQRGIEQSGYGLVDVRTGVMFGAGRWDLGLFVRNAFDRDYLIDAGNTGLNFGVPTFIVGAPRTWGVELTGNF